MYSLTTPPGPIPTTIQIRNSPAVDKFTIFEPPPIRKFDPNFNADTETYEGTPALPRPHPVEEGPAARARHDHFRAALPDLQRHILHPAAHAHGQRRFEHRWRRRQPRRSPFPPATSKRSRTAPKRLAPPLLLPQPPRQRTRAASALSSLLAFGFGLAAIFTPCVFPMIPITMSYFVGTARRTSARRSLSASASSFSSAVWV